jgi:hypothetical protein
MKLIRALLSIILLGGLSVHLMLNILSVVIGVRPQLLTKIFSCIDIQRITAVNS